MSQPRPVKRCKLYCTRCVNVLLNIFWALTQGKQSVAYYLPNKYSRVNQLFTIENVNLHGETESTLFPNPFKINFYAPTIIFFGTILYLFVFNSVINL